MLLAWRRGTVLALRRLAVALLRRRRSSRRATLLQSHVSLARVANFPEIECGHEHSRIAEEVAGRVAAVGRANWAARADHRARAQRLDMGSPSGQACQAEEAEVWRIARPEAAPATRTAAAAEGRTAGHRVAVAAAHTVAEVVDSLPPAAAHWARRQAAVPRLQQRVATQVACRVRGRMGDSGMSMVFRVEEKKDSQGDKRSTAAGLVVAPARAVY